MFRAHVLIVRRAKLYYTVSGIITPIGGLIIKLSASSWLILRNKYIEMHGQQNIKKCSHWYKRKQKAYDRRKANYCNPVI